MRRTAHSLEYCALMATIVGLAAARSVPATSLARISDLDTSTSSLATSVPIVKVHRYRMDGKIRPLLFWIGRGGVGSGEIVWRSDGSGARAWELLIGSDPDKAPRRLNRWGYIVEAVQDGYVRVVGLMSTSEEASLSDVEHDLSAATPHSRFKTIAATVANGRSSTVTGTIDAGRDVTLHDAPELVNTAQRAMAGLTPRVNDVPDHVRPGFLSAVAEIIDLTLAAAPNGRPAVQRLAGRRVPYVYGVKTFDLVLTAVASRRSATAARVADGAVLASRFEIRPHAGGDRHTFEIEYPAAGDLAGVPTLIRYQPRWWLQVELELTARPIGPPGPGR
ncbi:MAG: hypothetical protein AB1806_03310 [Acidobacteriota bacterium]